MANKCEVEVEMASGSFKGEGGTVEEAFMNVPLTFMQVKYKGVVSVKKDDKKDEILFMMPQLRRMFATKTARIHWAHQIEKFVK